MKKITYIIFTIILFAVICFSVIFFQDSLAVSDNDDNSKIIGEVSLLEDYAKEYISLNNVTTSSSELVFQYIRRNRYNDSYWNTLLGTIDSDFVDFVSSKDGIDINDQSTIIDLDTYKDVDFVHLMAVLNCYYKYGDNVSALISSDYAGYGGDLLTFLEEMTNYRINNSITDRDTLVNYAISLIGTNRNSTFDSSDMYADLDAINIYKSSDIDLENISEALEKYYILASSNYNYKNRVSSARAYIGESETALKEKAYSLMQNTMVQSMLVPSLSSKVTALDYEVVSESFANYMLEKPYLVASSTSGSMTVGDRTITVQLYESNLGLPKITLSHEICEVEIVDDVMYITATNAGNTVITVSSSNGLASINYSLTSTNVAPSIITNLSKEYDFFSEMDSSISIEALGTNNTYTWYISDSIDGEFTKLGVTVTPKYTFKPTMDYDKKYIKCVISNEGNDSVVSNIALLRIKNVSLGDIVNTGDITLMLAFSITFLVISANFLMYVLRKKELIVKSN